MTETLSLSRAGADLIKSFEACREPAGPGRFKPYICPAGRLTIGWGHTNALGRTFKDGDVWTGAECDAAFLADMAVVAAYVRRLVKVDLTQGQFDALVSFTYNCGVGDFSGSTLLKRVNAGDMAGAQAEFAKWDHSNGVVLPGLLRRREAEASLFGGSSSAA
jgi:lysozyme